jgi:hypothetical protein
MKFFFFSLFFLHKSNYFPGPAAFVYRVCVVVLMLPISIMPFPSLSFFFFSVLLSVLLSLSHLIISRAFFFLPKKNPFSFLPTFSLLSHIYPYSPFFNASERLIPLSPPSFFTLPTHVTSSYRLFRTAGLHTSSAPSKPPPIFTRAILNPTPCCCCCTSPLYRHRHPIFFFSHPVTRSVS